MNLIVQYPTLLPSCNSSPPSPDPILIFIVIVQCPSFVFNKGDDKIDTAQAYRTIFLIIMKKGYII